MSKIIKIDIIMRRVPLIILLLTTITILQGCINVQNPLKDSTEVVTNEFDSITVITTDGEHKISLQEFINRANNGDRSAQYTVGRMYLFGNGIEQSYEHAVEWLKKSAEQNFAPAQQELGLCYYRGTGVAQSFVDAVYWYRKSAEQGFSYGQHCLGVCYMQGSGVIQSDIEAVKWFMKAAEQGLAESQINLADCYLNGWGVKANRDEAIRWYLAASNQGVDIATQKLKDLNVDISCH